MVASLCVVVDIFLFLVARIAPRILYQLTCYRHANSHMQAVKNTPANAFADNDQHKANEQAKG
jgi:hypothetical protein